MKSACIILKCVCYSGMVRALQPRIARGLMSPLLAPLWSAGFSFSKCHATHKVSRQVTRQVWVRLVCNDRRRASSDDECDWWFRCGDFRGHFEKWHENQNYYFWMRLPLNMILLKYSTLSCVRREWNRFDKLGYDCAEISGLTSSPPERVRHEGQTSRPRQLRFMVMRVNVNVNGNIVMNINLMTALGV